MDNAGLCFSTLPILRCASFSRLENQVLIIPTALEVIFSTTLVFTNWKSGRRFLLITAESWLYLAVAVLELLSHLLSDVRTNLNIFRAIDLTIAAVALVPVFFYTLFIFLFMRAELIDILPRRFQPVCKYTVLFFIPSILAVDGVASFLGISYRMLPVRGNQSVIGIGFNTLTDRNIWSFLTSIALALHTAFQAINFTLAFFRIAKAFFIQRQIETSSSDEAYLFKGIDWMAGGLKLGAIETVVGFAQGGFGGALTRRILRFLSRACLCIGIVKGADTHENFSRVRDEMSSKPSPKGRLLISNPRTSTVFQMSPSAAAFHAAPRAAPVVGQPQLSSGLPGMSQLADMKGDDENSVTRQQRVTVLFQGGAPTLHMRFSALNVPSPAVIAESIKARPTEADNWNRLSRPQQRPSSYHAATSTVPAGTARTPIFTRHTRAFSDYSTNDSLTAVRELAAQFPGLPPRVTERSNQQQRETQSQVPWEDPYPSTSLSRGGSSATQSSRSGSLGRSLSHSSSIRRKPVPRLSDNIDPFSDDGDELIQQEGIAYVPPVAETRQATTHNHQPSMTDSFGSTPITNFSAPSGNETDITTPASEDPFVYDEYPPNKSRIRSSSSKLRPDSEIRAVDEYVQSPALNTLEEEEEDEVLSRIRRAVPAARIKSVGNAPRRSTPRPNKTHTLARGSIYIEPILIPPRPSGMPEAVQDMDLSQSVTSNYSSALRDSDIFGRNQEPHVQYS